MTDPREFVVHEARLIDEQRWDAWYDLFAEDGHYWVPAAPGQPDPHDHNSLAYEDRLLLRLRIERLKARPFSQHPRSRCQHVLQAPELVGELRTRTPFLYAEARGDEQVVLAGVAWHDLVRQDGGLRIRLKRVDLLNCDAALPSIQLFP